MIRPPEGGPPEEFSPDPPVPAGERPLLLVLLLLHLAVMAVLPVAVVLGARVLRYFLPGERWSVVVVLLALVTIGVEAGLAWRFRRLARRLRRSAGRIHGPNRPIPD